MPCGSNNTGCFSDQKTTELKVSDFSNGAVREDSSNRESIHLVSPLVLEHIATFMQTKYKQPTVKLTRYHFMDFGLYYSNSKSLTEKADIIASYMLRLTEINNWPTVPLLGITDEVVLYQMLVPLGKWLQIGANKYSAWNWAKGIPNERHYASYMRHTVKWITDAIDEDHMAAMLCNLMFMMHNVLWLKEVKVGNKVYLNDSSSEPLQIDDSFVTLNIPVVKADVEK